MTIVLSSASSRAAFRENTTMKTVLALTICGVSLAVSGCSSSTSDTPSDPGPAAQNPPASYTVLVTGTLKDDEPASKTTHDGVVGGTRDQASKLGDVAHGAFLGEGTRKEF